jgi:hypothetical protein
MIQLSKKVEPQRRKESKEIVRANLCVRPKMVKIEPKGLNNFHSFTKNTKIQGQKDSSMLASLHSRR